jgi:endonuclease G
MLKMELKNRQRSNRSIILLIGLFILINPTTAQDLFPKSEHPIITHKAYSLGYSEGHEQAAWVYYLLTAEECIARFKRTDRFVVDPAVTTGSATVADYQGSGYDRGHLAPAADMAWSDTSMSESFYFSNMSPQDPSFNRGIWKKLEAQVRDWAAYYDSLYIVTGPLLDSGLSVIGPNQVAVPNYYYKAVLDLDSTHQTAIAFLLPNIKSAASLPSLMISIDSLECLTQIDFFHDLEDSLEGILESRSDLNQWDFNVASVKSAYTTRAKQSAQCLGSTASGNDCENNTSSSNGYCHVHQSQVPLIAPEITEIAVQCAGITQKGFQCKRKTKNANGRCSQHQ